MRLRPPTNRPSFVVTYLTAFARPRHAMAALLEEPRRLRWGAYSVAITATTYTLVYFFLSHSGGRPTVFTPWLAIPADAYYRYNLLLHAPSLLIAWISAGGAVQLVARPLGGSGTFEDTLAVLGFGIGLASWATGLHDVVTAFFGYLGHLDQRAYEDAMSTPGTGPHLLIWSLMIVYLFALLGLFSGGIATAHKLRWAPALATGSLAFVVYQGVFMIFNR